MYIKIYIYKYTYINTSSAVVDATVATHNIITLHDLERHVILKLRDFADVSTFEQLGLGALVWCVRV